MLKKGYQVRTKVKAPISLSAGGGFFIFKGGNMRDTSPILEMSYPQNFTGFLYGWYLKCSSKAKTACIPNLLINAKLAFVGSTGRIELL